MPHANQEDERRPLLSHDEKQDNTTIAHESRVLLQYTVPLAAINLLRYARHTYFCSDDSFTLTEEDIALFNSRTIVQTASIFCLGRLGTRELASANLGNLTVNVLGYAVQIGLIS